MPIAAPSIGGPAIVLALVLAEVAVGGLAVLWMSPAWGRVRAAFFKLVGAVLAAAAILAWLAARAPLGGGTQTALLAAFAAVALAWQLLLWSGARNASRLFGVAAIPVGIAALVSIAAHPSADATEGVAVFQLLAGALFAGAATDGLLLGHWYLVERKLSRDPLARMNHLFLFGAALAALAAVMSASGGGEARADLSPLLGAGALAAWLAVGLALLCALIGGFIRVLVRENSMQAATGLFYLGVILALAAEFSAKVRFF